MTRAAQRRRFGSAPPPRYFAVSASEQNHGRGTSGRDWIGRPGNCFVTACVPTDSIRSVPVTLLPLKVGTIVASHVHRILRQNGSADSIVKVKWPNDVLVNDKKIAGVLIESHYDPKSGDCWFLVGVGLNVAHAPRIYQFGSERGRQATCLADHVPDYVSGSSGDDCDAGDDGVEQARRLASDLASSICSWASESSRAVAGSIGHTPEAAEAVVREWEGWAEFGKVQILRDKPGNEAVVPLGIEPDGRLRVRGNDGRIRLLCADYLL